jgi:hypothetical protein
MGLCGETTIANKKASWVTMIQVNLCTGCQPWKLELIALSRFLHQVFEYFISHHQVSRGQSRK